MGHTTRRADPRAAKTRDISRGLLACCQHKMARTSLNEVRRRYRRTSRQAARTVGRLQCTCGLDSVEECPRCDGDHVVDYPMWDRSDAVYWRRVYDTVGPISRWGRYHAARIDGDDHETYRWFRATLPGGMHGNHALFHLRFARVFDVPDL